MTAILTPLPEASFVEYENLKAILEAASPRMTINVVGEVKAGERSFAVYVATLGSSDPRAPAIGFFAGIHGLERIGTQLLLDYMRVLLCRLEWDQLLQQQLQSVRLVFMPIVNPGGMWAMTRSNPNGVDLMRNAPQSAEGRVPFLAGGQRIGPWLPWYRGRRGAPMEVEAALMIRVVEEELMSRPLSFALDCHSGYGFRDSIWFPYAKSTRHIAHLPEMYALKAMLEGAYPHHGYLFEPQSLQYLAHGDLWDYAYDRVRAPSVFLPLTLELGSWLWIKENPLQILKREGIFNPIKAHRTERVLRRHATLFDFLARVAYAGERWLPQGIGRQQLMTRAIEHWYRRHRQ
ncbi:M14 family zinc carboxypeptidase [Trinickia sp. EG282A]|uniref:M14 family zinc carboxypeptidase n=1 Tax=Trinickia sp. EG282A TaxID=3237013 RepID=UPI0034D2068C